ncbi:hypothetical protein RESH_04891 [Rhodopirellula europaea SH398]|uniref:Uncharacterized protein n=1 Tax=Rhodopirellula europaea SH398 TaxID=1263868 RepID=M5RYZ5_9BACT|nr:hypothetical protein RESH_04891 [Rhodopirellula europaea SH398]
MRINPASSLNKEAADQHSRPEALNVGQRHGAGQGSAALQGQKPRIERWSNLADSASQ